MIGRTRIAHRPVLNVPILLILVLGLTACDSEPVRPFLETGNVNFQIGAEAVQSDSGVIVNGHMVIAYPRNHEALWVDRFDHYRFGGFPEHDYAQSTRRSLSWWLSFRHGHPPEDGDSLIFSFVDHGEATVAGEPMERFDDLPHVGPNVPVRFENFIDYRARPFVWAEWWHGGEETWEHAPYFEDLIAGAELTIQTTGSDEVAPLSGTFSVTPFAELTGIASGNPLSLDGDMPVVRTDAPLTLEFTRPLDPAHSFIALFPFRGIDGRHAFIQPRSAVDRVVIPAEALTELVEGAEGSRLAYMMIVLEVHSLEGAIEGVFRESGDAFSIPFVQRGETGVHLYLER
jgi:hypothetical protein